MPSLDNEVFGAFITANVNVGSIISGFDTTEAFVSANKMCFYYYFWYLVEIIHLQNKYNQS